MPDRGCRDSTRRHAIDLSQVHRALERVREHTGPHRRAGIAGCRQARVDRSRILPGDRRQAGLIRIAPLDVVEEERPGRHRLLREDNGTRKTERERILTRDLRRAQGPYGVRKGGMASGSQIRRIIPVFLASCRPARVRALGLQDSCSSSSRGTLPSGAPYTLSRSPLRRLAPFAWLARCVRSHSGQPLEADEFPAAGPAKIGMDGRAPRGGRRLHRPDLYDDEGTRIRGE